ncbi:MAG: RDD family protein, partial [Gammaproteobacteria bacterium]|nr:RDD family protein [Gammaproteobacteria bacterium]
MSNIDNPDASVLKRLYALIYDGLLLIAIDMVFVLLPASFLITFKEMDTHSSGYVATIIAATLLVHYLFYTWFWTHGGQTLGMRAWKLKLIST